MEESVWLFPIKFEIKLNYTPAPKQQQNFNLIKTTKKKRNLIKINRKIINRFGVTLSLSIHSITRQIRDYKFEWEIVLKKKSFISNWESRVIEKPTDPSIESCLLFHRKDDESVLSPHPTLILELKWKEKLNFVVKCKVRFMRKQFGWTNNNLWSFLKIKNQNNFKNKPKLLSVIIST